MATYNELINSLIDQYQEDDPNDQVLKLRKTDNDSGLIDHFRKGKVPDQGDFYGLIYNMLSRAEEGLFKSSNLPLSILATPDEQKPLLHFYVATDQTPSWQIGLRVPTEPEKMGLGISEGTGNTHLFIEEGSNHIGIGTTSPHHKLEVEGKARANEVVLLLDDPYLSTELAGSDFGVSSNLPEGFGSQISSFGNILAVSAPNEYANIQRSSVFIYHFDKNQDKWLARDVIRATNYSPETPVVRRRQFGASISLHDKTLAIAATNDRLNEGDGREGIVYLFRYDENTGEWSSSGRFTGFAATESSNGQQSYGPSVSLFDKHLIIAQSESLTSGSIYWYTYDSNLNQWISHESLDPSSFGAFVEAQAIAFSARVKIYSNWLAVGLKLTATNSDPQSTSNNAVGVYRFDESTENWIPQSVITSNNIIDRLEYDFGSLGSQIAIEGNYMVIGAFSQPLVLEAQGTTIPAVGAVYSFKYNMQTEQWTFLSELRPTDFSNDLEIRDGFFGIGLALSENLLVISQRGSTNDNPRFENVFLYELDKTGESWEPLQVITQPNMDPNDNETPRKLFGHNLHLHGNTILIGASLHYNNDTGRFGRIYTYQREILLSQALKSLNNI